MTATAAWHALAGGGLIGVAVAALLLLNGRIGGVSGIVGSLINADPGEQAWRLAFVAGMLAPALLFGVRPSSLPPGWVWAAIAGVLVGVGTRLGGGSTSGHGVCGLANFSRRSLLATLVFMAAAMLTVFFIRHAGAS